MKFIDENYKPITSLKDHQSRMMWIYDLERHDFFLKPYVAWYHLSTPTYQIKIAGIVIHIPANFHILIGDYDAGFDTITPNELVGRKFEVFSFHPNLIRDSGLLLDMEVCGYSENEDFLIPFTKNPSPIMLSDKISIMVSSQDFYNKIKVLSFDDIV